MGRIPPSHAPFVNHAGRANRFLETFVSSKATLANQRTLDVRFGSKADIRLIASSPLLFDQCEVACVSRNASSQEMGEILRTHMPCH